MAGQEVQPELLDDAGIRYPVSFFFLSLSLTHACVSRWHILCLVSFLIDNEKTNTFGRNRSFVGTILLMTIPNETFSQHIGLLISYYITLSFWSAQTLGLSMMSRNVGGQTKKSVVVATNFIFWAVGNTIGPQVFLGVEAPTYHTAFATHLGCYGLLVLVIVYFRWYLVSQNKKRDALAASGVAEAHDEDMVHAFDDLTDRENPNFRYVY